MNLKTNVVDRVQQLIQQGQELRREQLNLERQIELTKSAVCVNGCSLKRIQREGRSDGELETLIKWQQTRLDEHRKRDADIKLKRQLIVDEITAIHRGDPWPPPASVSHQAEHVAPAPVAAG